MTFLDQTRDQTVSGFNKFIIKLGNVAYAATYIDTIRHSLVNFSLFEAGP
jgi:hypothetical protein